MKIISILLNKKILVIYDDTGKSYSLDSDHPQYQDIIDNGTSEIMKHGYYVIDELQPVTQKKSLENALKVLSSIADVEFFKTISNNINNIIDNMTDIVKRKPVNIDDEPSYKTETKSVRAVAITKDNETISGIENIINQTWKYPENVGELVKRVCNMKNKQSAEDLLSFLQKADLPITVSGKVLAYKMVNQGPFKGTYVDCHTGSVVQRVGSLVCMDRTLVDHDRARECSNGLHVARRDYLPGFRGDYCLLIEFDPEDVVAVPYCDASKIRISKYHILAELSATTKDELVHNKPMTNEFDLDLLSKGVNEEFPLPKEEVRIVSQEPTTIETTKFDLEYWNNHRSNVRSGTKKKKVKDVKPLDSVMNTKKTDIQKVASKETPATRMSFLGSLQPYSKETVLEMESIRKIQKKSYKSYGLTDKQIEEIKKVLRS